MEKCCTDDLREETFSDIVGTALKTLKWLSPTILDVLNERIFFTIGKDSHVLLKVPTYYISREFSYKYLGTYLFTYLYA